MQMYWGSHDGDDLEKAEWLLCETSAEFNNKKICSFYSTNFSSF